MKPQHSESIFESYQQVAQNPAIFLHQYAHIRHPMHGLMPFHLWRWQVDLLKIYEAQRHVIILKARQLGVSELSIGYALWLTRFHPGRSVLVVSKNEDMAQELLQRARVMHDHLPEWLIASEHSYGRTHVGKSNESVLEFIHQRTFGTVSSWIQSVPATKNTGRGSAASLVILDEWAHQLYDDDIWAAIEPTVSTGGRIIGISTANGLGNVFHRQWTRAVGGQNTFYPVFLAWDKHPDRDEQWYHQTTRNMDPWQLHQEYPSNPAEAFVQSGRPVFDASYLQCDESPILEQHDGLTVWEDPQEDHTYLLTADVAEGLVNGDYDAGLVIDRDTGGECAELHGHWPPEIFAAKLADLGMRYNYALLAPERNNHGHAVLLALRSLGYPTIYQHADAFTGAADARPGFPTTAQTKAVAVASLAQMLREGTWHIRSQAALAELQIFHYADNGSMGAPQGYHDDHVATRWIAAWIMMHPTSQFSGDIPPMILGAHRHGA